MSSPYCCSPALITLSGGARQLGNSPSVPEPAEIIQTCPLKPVLPCLSCFFCQSHSKSSCLHFWNLIPASWPTGCFRTWPCMVWHAPSFKICEKQIMFSMAVISPDLLPYHASLNYQTFTFLFWADFPSLDSSFCGSKDVIFWLLSCAWYLSFNKHMQNELANSLFSNKHGFVSILSILFHLLIYLFQYSSTLNYFL